MSQSRNLFDAIVAQGSDNGFRPRVTKEFQATSAQAGSPEKVAVLRWRMERGLPLWHRDDRTDLGLDSDVEIPVFSCLGDNPR